MANLGPTDSRKLRFPPSEIGKLIKGTVVRAGRAITEPFRRRREYIQKKEAAERAQREKYRVEAEKQRAWQDYQRREQYRTDHPDRARPTEQQRRQRGSREAFRRSRARVSGRGASGRNGGR